MGLINYMHSCFCKHDYKPLGKVNIYESEVDKIPIKIQWIYLCNKCGRVKKNKELKII